SPYAVSARETTSSSPGNSLTAPHLSRNTRVLEPRVQSPPGALSRLHFTCHLPRRNRRLLETGLARAPGVVMEPWLTCHHRRGTPWMHDRLRRTGLAPVSQ